VLGNGLFSTGFTVFCMPAPRNMGKKAENRHNSQRRGVFNQFNGKNSPIFKGKSKRRQWGRRFELFAGILQAIHHFPGKKPLLIEID